MPATDQILKFVGELIAYGGGSAAIAYFTFQFLGQRWIENKFAEKLELLRHTQALELQRLRVEIDSMLSGAIKIQEKEFEVLPEAWRLLDEACCHVRNLVAPIQQYPDLDKFRKDQLEEFLASAKFLESEKNDIRNAQRKKDTAQEIIFWRRFDDVLGKIDQFHNYIFRNSMFMPTELKIHFENVSNQLWSAMLSEEIGHGKKDWKMHYEGWDKIEKDIKPLQKKIGDIINSRLQAHGKGA